MQSINTINDNNNNTSMSHGDVSSHPGLCQNVSEYLLRHASELHRGAESSKVSNDSSRQNLIETIRNAFEPFVALLEGTDAAESRSLINVMLLGENEHEKLRALCVGVSATLHAHSVMYEKIILPLTASALSSSSGTPNGLGTDSTSQKIPPGVLDVFSILRSTLQSFPPHSADVSTAEGKQDGKGAADRRVSGGKQLWYTFLMHFLKQLSARGGDYAPWVALLSSSNSTGLSSTTPPAPIMSEALLASTICRTRNRRSALLCKSLCPHIPLQAPSTTFWIMEALDYFLLHWQRASSDKATCVQRRQSLFTRVQPVFEELIGKSNVHASFLASVIVTQLCLHYILQAPQGYATKTLTGIGGTATTPFTASATKSTTAPQKNSSASEVATNERLQGIQPNGPFSPEDSSSVIFGPRMEFDAEMEKIAAYDGVTAAAERAHCSSDSGDAMCDNDEESSMWWNQFAPLGMLLENVAPQPLLHMHFFNALSQLRVENSMAARGKTRQRVALLLYTTGAISLDAAYVCYHSAILLETSTSPLSPLGTAPPGEALAALSRQMHKHAQDAYMARILPAAMTQTVVPKQGNAFPGSSAANRGKKGGGESGDMTASTTSLAACILLGLPHDALYAAEAVLKEVPHSGELVGPRFSRMAFPVPFPAWEDYLVCDAHSYASSNYSSDSPLLGGTNSTTSAATPAAQSSSSLSGGVTISKRNHATAALVSPCSFLVDLLTLDGNLLLITEVLRGFLGQYSNGKSPAALKSGSPVAASHLLNVFIVPKAALSTGVSVQTALLDFIWVRMRTWNETETRIRSDLKNANGESGSALSTTADALRRLHLLDADRYEMLDRFLELFRVCGQYLAFTPFIVEVLKHVKEVSHSAVESCRAAIASHGRRTTEDSSLLSTLPPMGCFNLLRAYVTDAVLPWMRVLPPSELITDALAGLLACSEELAAHLVECQSRSIPLVSDRDHNDDEETQPAAVITSDLSPCPFEMLPWMQRVSRLSFTTLFPHDALLTKENDTLLQQSLKRMTRDTVDRYAAVLQPVLYSNPLMFIEKLISQAVGYDNEYLVLHMRLLHRAPASILKLALWAGTSSLKRYASEEREGCEDRCFLVACWLVTLWRDNPDSFDGRNLLHTVELSLKREARADLIVATELLRAMLRCFGDERLESEEQHNDVQQRALCTPPSTRWFARGAAESFRRQTWSKWFTPAQRAESTALLAASMATDAISFSSRKTTRTNGAACWLDSVGGQIILQMCRLQTRIYDMNADLSGTVEMILLTSAKDTNRLTDLILFVAEMLPARILGAAASWSEGAAHDKREKNALQKVCLPHVLSKLSAVFTLKQAELGLGSQSNGELFHGNRSLFIPALLSRNALERCASSQVFTMLSQLTCNHLRYDDAVYESALVEVLTYIRECGYTFFQQNGAATPQSKSSENLTQLCTHFAVNRLDADPYSFAWAKSELLSMSRERASHFEYEFSSSDSSVRIASRGSGGGIPSQCKQTTTGEALRCALFSTLKSAVVGQPDLSTTTPQGELLLDDPVFFVSNYLLPRTLLSLEDAMFVAELCGFIIRHAREQNDSATFQKAVDVVLTFVSSVAAMFTGFTDSECRRLGVVLHHIVSVVELESALGMMTAPVPSTGSLSMPRGTEEAAEAVVEVKKEDVKSSESETHKRECSSKQQRQQQQHPQMCPLVSLLRREHDGTGGAALQTMAKSSPLSILSPQHFTQLCNEVRGMKNSAAHAEHVSHPSEAAITSTSCAFALATQLEVYLTKFFFHVLHNRADVPTHVHRNALQVLGRLLAPSSVTDAKGSLHEVGASAFVFPTQATSLTLLAVAVSPHAVKSSTCFAPASAVLKKIQKGRSDFVAARATRVATEVEQQRTALVSVLLAKEHDMAFGEEEQHITDNEDEAGAEHNSEKSGSEDDEQALHMHGEEEEEEGDELDDNSGSEGADSMAECDEHENSNDDDADRRTSPGSGDDPQRSVDVGSDMDGEEEEGEEDDAGEEGNAYVNLDTDPRSNNTDNMDASRKRTRGEAFDDENDDNNESPLRERRSTSPATSEHDSH